MSITDEPLGGGGGGGHGGSEVTFYREIRGSIKDSGRTSEGVTPGVNTEEIPHCMMVGDSGKYNTIFIPIVLPYRGDEMYGNGNADEVRGVF